MFCQEGTPQARSHHAVFHTFLSDDRKQYSDTTIDNSKHIIELLKQRNIMFNKLITVLVKKGGCAEHYICATALYLMSILSQGFSVIIDHSISAPGHGRELVYVINSIGKGFSSN